MNIKENLIFDEERALYESRDLTVRSCKFEGPQDGESAFKECVNIRAEKCFFDLRYPFWHDDGADVFDCEFTDRCRAAFWYSRDINIASSKLHGTKALRECKNVNIENCDIRSDEFGWSVEDIKMSKTAASGEYFMLRSSNLHFSDFTLIGKYSFQYIKNSEFSECTFKTKDAFWHAENTVIRNSTVEGEYLAWYSDGLTFENCDIIGTQPFCYCKNLKLINCRMHGADLAFEKSEVDAEITSHVISIKNPTSGTLKIKSVGEIIDFKSGACKILCIDE